jgi:serine phosphatase RsbU (regulator of sigma subunit)
MDSEKQGPGKAKLPRDLPETTSAGLLVVDTRLRYVYVNPALAALNGLPVDAHLGRPVHEVLPGSDALEQTLHAVLADGRTRQAVSSRRTRDEQPPARRYWLGVYDLWEVDGEKRGVVGVVTEVSQPYHELQRVERARERLSVFDAARERIGTTLDATTTCAELADFAVPLLADLAVVDLLPRPYEHSVPAPVPTGDGRTRMCRGALVAVPRLRRVAQSFDGPGTTVDHQAGSVVDRVLREGEPVRENYASGKEMARLGPNAERSAAYRAAGGHSTMAVPLTARDSTLGALVLMRAGESPAFSDEDELAAREIATRAAVSLDHALHFEHEHTIARELQEALLTEPSGPHADIEIATRYLPAGSDVLVGGDWFDAIALPRGRTLKVMGDVMGHGLQAAVAMSHYRSLVRGLASADLEPHEILTRMDAMVTAAGFDRVATCLIEIVDPRAGSAALSSAGHLPPALIEHGRIRLVDLPSGPPLGTGVGGYVPHTIPRTPGPVMLMYTDGLVERRHEDIDVSLERLTGLRVGDDTTDLDRILDALLDTLGAEAQDDVAVMASRLRPVPSRPSAASRAG